MSRPIPRSPPPFDDRWSIDIEKYTETSKPVYEFLYGGELSLIEREDAALRNVNALVENTRRKKNKYKPALSKGETIHGVWKVINGPIDLIFYDKDPYEDEPQYEFPLYELYVVKYVGNDRDDIKSRDFILKTHATGLDEYILAKERDVLVNHVPEWHDNILPVLDYGTFRKDYEVYEFIVHPFFSFTADDPEFVNIVRLERDVREGLKHLHRFDIAHGSIKPKNIVWVPDLRKWAITDFKNARLSGHLPGLTEKSIVDVKYNLFKNVKYDQSDINFVSPQYLVYGYPSFEDDFGMLANTLDYLRFKQSGGKPKEWTNPFALENQSARKRRLFTVRDITNTYMEKYLLENPIKEEKVFAPDRDQVPTYNKWS